MIPTEINLLGTTFRVQVCPMDKTDAGVTETCARLIQINEEMPADVQVETFYHELVHAILDHTGVGSGFTPEQNEQLAQCIGMSLTYLMAANQLPKLGEKTHE